jgi:lycopene beta-cyclase
MAPMDTWDVVIAGAGLAGLALAAELAEPEFAHLRVLLIEPRKIYVRDRTWSYWALPHALPKRWQGLPTTQWPQWRVSLAERSVLSKSEVPYASVRADAFYDAALGMIAKVPHIQWLRETSIRQVDSTAHGVEITTNAAQCISSKWLFDSRPPKPSQASDWVQHFAGWEVEAASPCFEPQCVDLMAFERHQSGLHFFYCLPYSNTQALVESTWISRASLQRDYEAELRQALQQRWGCADYAITFREQGALPLMPRLGTAQPHVVRIGRAGGMLRAATGYAFCASLQQTASLAASLKEHFKDGKALVDWQALPFKTSAMDQWMDSVLFRVLESDWQAAPQYFLSLFERVPELQLIRFLQGQASAQDRVAVMRALPAWPFMRAALG